MHTLQSGMGWFPEQTGGLNRVFFNLMEYLPSVGVGAEGLVAGSQQVDIDSEGRVRAFARGEAPLPVRWLRARQQATERLETGRFDLVASHFALYSLPFIDAVAPRPLVVHFHGPWAAESAVEGAASWAVSFKRRLERAVYDRADRFIVLSQAFKQVLSTTYGVPLALIEVCQGGVNVDAYDTGLTRAYARHSLGWPSDRPIILAVRRLARRMGLENLLEAVDAVRIKLPDVLLLIAGKGPIAEELAARIETMDLGNHVRLLGFVPDADLPLAYRAADLSVVPTVSLEGFGLITVESLAAGTPVLVTPVGGLPEILEGLAPQLILPDTSPGALAEGIRESLLGTLGLPDANACRSYAREHYDWSVAAARVRDVYREVLG